VGTIAELHKNKGLSYALEAFAKLPASFSFHIIGSGEEEKKLKILAHHLKITNRVYWHGFIENASAYLKAFDIFLLPSIKEGLPYVLLEAGCAEIPTIATNVGSISEIIKPNETGILLQPANTQAIIDALLFFSSHEKEKALYAENLKKLVEEQFSTEKMLEKLLAIYRID
jgi:glycosyltransferase involved in cell wall biosynthesis